MLQHLRTARCLCDFDSSVAEVRAVSRSLRGQDFPALAMGPGSAWLADVLSRLPSRARRRAYVLLAGMQGAPGSTVQGLTSEDLAAWTARQYGTGPYPAVFIGASSGAAVHLAAALGAPVLPQTYLVPVRTRLDPDRPRAAMVAGRELGRRMVEANPDLALCHMHDPNQDRAMIVRFAYFRFKRLRLGVTLQSFLERRLAPGAAIFVVDCTLTWPMSVLGERYRFQFGALGGMTADEYMGGSERIARHLAEQGASVRQWDAPPPDELYPEAEWGYDAALTDDVLELARRCGYQVRRITIGEPEHLSPLVAEFHRWWYRRRGLPDDRLLIETYNQWEPYWALRLGVVPFWLQFTTRPSYRCATDYLTHADPYQRIHVNLFSNGLRSAGLVPVEHWRGLARRYARTSGGTIGVDERAYPGDLGSTLTCRRALAALPERHPIPPPVGMAELDEFLAGMRGTAAYRAAPVESLLGPAG
ncbi:hypothetical protein ABT009_03100 [Streptomyces sp. NPDC002896]|uniref:hypothetical protein n=1 Tax=Streptomyces sp. NPDC002896 TaxID=3154438 RepID=UPI00332303D3